MDEAKLNEVLTFFMYQNLIPSQLNRLIMVMDYIFSIF